MVGGGGGVLQSRWRGNGWRGVCVAVQVEGEVQSLEEGCGGVIEVQSSAG